MVKAGDDLAALIAERLTGELALRKGDVLVLAQKIVSKAEGRLVEIATVKPSQRAIELAAEVQKDPRLVELILSESVRVVRSRPNVLIVEHRLGFVMANAGIDQSNVAPQDGVERALLLPKDPDASRRGAAGEARRDRADDHRQLRPPVAARHDRRGDRLGRPAGDARPARQSRPVRPHADGHHLRLRRRARGRGVAGHGPGRRGAAGGAGARPRAGSCRRPTPPSWCGRRPRTCSAKPAMRLLTERESQARERPALRSPSGCRAGRG